MDVTRESSGGHVQSLECRPGANFKTRYALLDEAHTLTVGYGREGRQWRGALWRRSFSRFRGEPHHHEERPHHGARSGSRNLTAWRRQTLHNEIELLEGIIEAEFFSLPREKPKRKRASYLMTVAIYLLPNARSEEGPALLGGRNMIRAKAHQTAQRVNRPASS